MPNDPFKIEDKHEGPFTSTKLRWSVPLHRLANLSIQFCCLNDLFISQFKWGLSLLTEVGWKGGGIQGTNKRPWEIHCSVPEFRSPNAAELLSETIFSETQGSITWWGQAENVLTEEHDHLKWVERCLQLGLSSRKAVFASPFANTGCDESWMTFFC